MDYSQFASPDGPLSAQELGALVAAAPGPLPEFYINLLRKFGPLYFKDAVTFDVAFERFDGTRPTTEEIEDAELDDDFLIYGLADPAKVQERMAGWARSPVAPLVPAHMMPIAIDVGSSILLMALGGTHAGSIWLWVAQSERWGTGDNLYIGRVADDLETFLTQKIHADA